MNDEAKPAMSAPVYFAAPVKKLSNGLMKLSVSDVTTAVNAPPIIIPIAISIILPLRANSLNS